MKIAENIGKLKMFGDGIKLYEQDMIGENLQVQLKMNTTTEQATSGVIHGSVMEVTQTNIVTLPKQVESIAVNKLDIIKIQVLCNDVVKEIGWWHDFYLGIATLSLGATLSAIISNVPFQLDWRGLLFYTLAPMVSIGAFVAYGLKRQHESTSKKDFANHILEYLPELKGEEK